MNPCEQRLYRWLGVAGLVAAFAFVVWPLANAVATVAVSLGVAVLFAGLAGLWYVNRRLGFVGT